ncbi:MAG TPA: RNA pseudouridine synthase [Gammaproteobacteria bacterium]|nr:RNA pseudouridine synthase [Gammaproteobacteria bacterium]
MTNANNNVEFYYQPPADNGLDVLYSDDALLVVNKPSGLLSVPGRGKDKQDCLVSRVQMEFSDALIVHRLDMETSGLMVLARNKMAHRQLSGLFQQRAVQKHYVAIVDGVLQDETGSIDLPLICDWPNRPRQKVDQQQGKPSRTLFTVLGPGIDAGSTRVKLVPETGRSHQLRVHMQSLGHAILGDRFYASEQALAKSPRLLLHAALLAFVHPLSAEPLQFVSDVPF